MNKAFETQSQNDPREREERWREIASVVEHIRDGLGKRIDDEIKHVVIGLRAAGIHTVQSCEGHLDRGTETPYIDVEAPGIAEAEAQAERFFEQGDKEAERRVVRQILQRNLEERRKIVILLSEFYAQREGVPFEQRLIIQNYGRGTSRIQSQGADLQEIEEGDTRGGNLRQYQQEMRTLGEFLRERFFSSRAD